MPTYRYRCDRCGDELEVWQSITADPLTEHDECGGELRKVLSAAGIVLKGSGFYKTDNRSGNGSRSTSDASTDSKGSGSKDSGAKDSGSKDSGSSGSGSGSESKGSSKSSDSGAKSSSTST